ncbi:MAG: hypothetical protein GY719_22955, partial [bacterium]|nr:hypothetical protein [bacterium]
MDHVLPDVPVRQWVLSLPHEIRYRIAFDPKLQSEVRGVFMRAVQSWIKRRMRDLGFPGGRTGGVACVQRFDSALRLDPHIHALVLDGVYIGLEDGGEATFHPLPKPSDEDIEKLVRSLHGRVYGLLRRRGVLHDGECEELTALGVCQAAAIQGRIPFGEEAGGYDEREGRRRGGVAPRAKRRLCADYEGFSLHAAIRVPAGQRVRLERLCRY